MERIILYYSDGGKTKVVAETLAINLRCDICQIKDMKKRDGIMNRFSSTIDAFRESKTEIYPPTLDLEEYDTIYIGTPTWANNPTPAIITLIDRCDLRGKDIVLFTTTSTSDGESALEKMEMKVRARGARVVQQFSVKTKDKSLAQLLRAFADRNRHAQHVRIDLHHQRIFAGNTAAGTDFIHGHACIAVCLRDDARAECRCFQHGAVDVLRPCLKIQTQEHA